MFDDIDLTLLDLLQRDARITNVEMARRVGLAPSAVFERLRRLGATRAIKGWHLVLDPCLFNRSLLAFVAVRASEPPSGKKLAEQFAEVPEVQEVHNVAGDDCYLLKVRVEGPLALGKLLRETIGVIPGVTATRSTIVLETYKETTRIPLADAPRKNREKRRATPSLESH